LSARAVSRATDVVARVGGDEFGVLAVDTALVTGRVLVARLADALAQAGVRASIGAHVRRQAPPRAPAAGRLSRSARTARVPGRMDLWQSLVLGLVQGLTEFLPISSSAHQRIVPALLGWEDPGAAFTAVTQLGTEAAVLLYFRKDLWRISTKWLRALRDPRLRGDPDVRLGWFIIVATIPIGILGFAFEAQIDTGARNLYLIGSVLVAFALVLLYADRVGRRDRGLDGLSVRDGVLIGLAQSLALVPGVSRSGATITAGLLLRLERAAAARFSFLLAIPAVVASGLFKLLDLVSGNAAGAESVAGVALATVVSFVVGYAAIAWLLRYLETHSVGAFVAYRVILGGLVLALVSAGAIA